MDYSVRFRASLPAHKDPRQQTAYAAENASAGSKISRPSTAGGASVAPQRQHSRRATSRLRPHAAQGSRAGQTFRPSIVTTAAGPSSPPASDQDTVLVALSPQR